MSFEKNRDVLPAPWPNLPTSLCLHGLLIMSSYHNCLHHSSSSPISWWAEYIHILLVVNTSLFFLLLFTDTREVNLLRDWPILNNNNLQTITDKENYDLSYLFSDSRSHYAQVNLLMHSILVAKSALPDYQTIICGLFFYWLSHIRCLLSMSVLKCLPHVVTLTRTSEKKRTSGLQFV